MGVGRGTGDLSVCGVNGSGFGLAMPEIEAGCDAALCGVDHGWHPPPALALLLQPVADQCVGSEECALCSSNSLRAGMASEQRVLFSTVGKIQAVDRRNSVGSDGSSVGDGPGNKGFADHPPVAARRSD